MIYRTKELEEQQAKRYLILFLMSASLIIYFLMYCCRFLSLSNFQSADDNILASIDDSC